MTQYLTVNGRTYNDDDISAGNPTGLGAGGFKTLWNQFVGDLLADLAIGLQMSSTTNLAIGAGLKVFTPAVLRGVNVGGYIQAINDAGDWMWGQISAIDNVGGTLTLNVTQIAGAGAHASWKLQPTGPQAPPNGSGWNYTGIVTGTAYQLANGEHVTADCRGAAAVSIKGPAAPGGGTKFKITKIGSGVLTILRDAGGTNFNAVNEDAVFNGEGHIEGLFVDAGEGYRTGISQ